MYQSEASGKKCLYPTKDLGHEKQAWYDRHREIHATVGVQIYLEMPKMRTSLQDSGTCHYVSTPMGYRAMEALAGNIGKDIAKRHTHPGLTIFLLYRLLELKTRSPRKAL
jgi:hypothetical protein